jgi:predicted lipoprotein with Yx(FWY)xxD motif
MNRRTLALGLAIAIFGVAACTGGGGATSAPTTVPATTVPATSAATTPPATTGTGTGATVNATAVGSAGTILVDGTSGMTLYVFAKDVKDSGKSNCAGDCLVTWPALTVPAGSTPTAGTGVTGTLSTITRTDDGTLQVTYNGLPLYFFKNDKTPGDLNGVYENWMTVTP